MGRMSQPALEAMHDFAVALARHAGTMSLAARDRLVTERKADRTVVTETDHAIQRHILAAIARQFPDHAVAAEEKLVNVDAHALLNKARYTWVLDPLDGTRNFVAGFPCFATSLALLDQGEAVIGVIAEHNLGQVFHTSKGSGAWLDDQPIQTREPNPEDDWLVAVPSTKDLLTVQVASRWIAARGLVCRNTGSTAIHLALVASGALAGAFCKRCKLWDVAAGFLLVCEAGGRVTDPQGRKYQRFALDADPDLDLPFLAGAAGAYETLFAMIHDVTTVCP